MKINKLSVILPAVAISGVALLVKTEVTGSYLSAVAQAVSYLAVAVLVALAALDYRVGSKTY